MSGANCLCGLVANDLSGFVLTRNEGRWTAPGAVDRPRLSFEHRRQPVSRQRFTPEFKEEAVKQVTERGHRASEMAARLPAIRSIGTKAIASLRPAGMGSNGLVDEKSLAAMCGFVR